MTSWRAVWEWYLGLPEAGAGEGTRWTWSTVSPWPDGWPAWLACVVAAVLVTSLMWSYRREAGSLSPRQRWLLCGLRFAAVLVALTLWSQPTLLVARTGLPPVAVLLDTSASMGLRDVDSSHAKRPLSPSPSQMGTLEQEAPCRWDQVATALQADDGRLLRQLLDEHPLRLYQFAGQAAAVGPPGLSEPEQLAATLAALAQLEPTGEQTRPAEAVRQVLAELRGLAPSAVVLFTDGIASEADADKLSTIADLVRRRGVQLIVVPVGSDEPVRDLQLYDVVVDDVAFVGDPVPVSGKIKTTGVPKSNITVQVRREGVAEPLARQELAVRGDGGTVRFELSLQPEEAGEWDLTIETPSVAGEVQRDNNLERRHLSIRQEKLKVLLVDAAPRYEFRYLKQWCEREKSIELKTLLLEADPEYAQEDRTAITYFPVQREELFAYDVLVLGDVTTAQLGATAAEWIAEFVREKGGGLVLIAGPRANPRGFAQTALGSLLPFSLATLGTPGESNEQAAAYAPQLTLDGQKGVPLFRFAESEAASLDVWNALPGFYGLLPIRKTKPGTRVLAEHPVARGDVERLPVFLLQQVGSGKVLFHATDETWRWRFRTGDQYFGRYWGQALRYLSRGHLLGKDRAAELIVDRQVYRRGEAVLLRVRFVDERLTPSGNDAVRVIVERAGEGRREIALTRLPYLPTVFEGQLTQLTDGAYHAWVSSPSFAAAPPVADFRVESPQRELSKRSVDRGDLRLAVERAGGQLVELSDVQRLAERIPTGDAVPLEQGAAVSLWNRFEPLVLLAGLLIAEWVLRRRWRLV
jgi:hypothetical protein